VLGEESVTSECGGTAGQAPIRVEHNEVQSGAETHVQPVVDQGGRGADADNSSPEPRMIGDFEGSANALWTLYGKEAKSHDEARIQTLKDDMDGVLIFVRPYFVRAQRAQSC
jgi:hypothetical protein